tara:strand:- start:104 stop:274 length:171 start_codon:yes stop_codon:yes gene_type:complete
MAQTKDYKQFKGMDDSTVVGVTRKSDGAFIPNTTDNIDWNEYLAWVSEGNTVEAAD